MTEQEILELIEQDGWMMEVLKIAEKQNLKNWIIGAGFVRNKVWDSLHGYNNKEIKLNDIDFVYFDPNGNDEKADDELSEKLKNETGMPWEIVNEAYAHVWKNLPPYISAEDAIAHWPETATSVGVTLENGKLKLIAPYGINDLVNLIIRMSPLFPDGLDVVKDRVARKGWLKKWPKLTLSL